MERLVLLNEYKKNPHVSAMLFKVILKKKLQTEKNDSCHIKLIFMFFEICKSINQKKAKAFSQKKIFLFQTKTKHTKK